MTMQRSLSKLRLVRIGKPLPQTTFETFAGVIRRAFAHVIEELEIVDHEPPPVDRIEASLLTADLDHRIGGHILGITDVDLVDRQGDDFFEFMFGGKDHRSHVAVVSTRRLASSRGQALQDRVFKVGLHELGHNFDLLHHYAFVRAPDGNYCPMSKGDYNRYGERGYVRSVVDGRGFRFCSGCRDFLLRFHHA
ncbi:MAG: hypothetical protein D6696_21355 [Acidobacteria bacterium]|nr:MAG: hypothetical protein D6696_21355 [Acidobacteriota bacterium]